MEPTPDVSEARRVYRRLVGAGILISGFLGALSVHTLLDWAQAARLLGGDYGSHTHASLGPVVLGLLIAAIGAAVLYFVHLLDTGPRTLPSLARAVQARLDWRAVMLVTAAACLTLFVMEMGEQLAAHHVDGFLSAFGDTPAIGFGMMFGVSVCIVATARAFCAWLAEAHARIVSVIFTILRISRGAVAPLRDWSVRLDDRSTSDDGVTSYIFGRRAPPTRLAR